MTLHVQGDNVKKERGIVMLIVTTENIAGREVEPLGNAITGK